MIAPGDLVFYFSPEDFENPTRCTLAFAIKGMSVNYLKGYVCAVYHTSHVCEFYQRGVVWRVGS